MIQALTEVKEAPQTRKLRPAVSLYTAGRSWHRPQKALNINGVSRYPSNSI